MEFLTTSCAMKECFDERAPSFVCILFSASIQACNNFLLLSITNFLFESYFFGHFMLLLDSDHREMTVVCDCTDRWQ